MKVSIITVVYNNEKTISHAVDSVLSQDYGDIEYIVVDGNSKDGTMDVLRGYGNRISKLISEKDKGLYDAMNKGIRAATGDVVGILNSDDFFYNNSIISSIVAGFKKNPSLDAVVGDIVFVKDDIEKVLRHYSSRKWQPRKFAWGYMPAHPSFFVKRELFEKLGYYKLDYKIAADYELLVRFLLVNKIKWEYLPVITTKMRMGGASTKNLNSIITLNKEIRRGCRENNVYTNYLMIYSKYLFKPFEFLTAKG
jgi:glycosyltransferase involved in cell wall biosynthesis